MIAKIVIIHNMLAAKQNQKFPFHFLSAPPLRSGKFERKENFWFLPRDRRERDEAQVSFVKILRILPEIHSNFVQYTPQKFGIRRNRQSGVAPSARHKRIPAKNSRIQKVFPRSVWRILAESEFCVGNVEQTALRADHIFGSETLFENLRCILEIARTEFCPRRALRGLGREGKKPVRLRREH